MAATLPTGITAQTTGHPALHNSVNAAVNEHDGRITVVEDRATTLESSSSSLDGRITAAESTISSQDARLTTAETNISSSLQPGEIAVAPNTELSLSGAGTVASPLTIGSATIIGAGRPDVPASMTTAVQAQVSAAPVGATFSSTDGASVGAWQWQKRPSGWIATSVRIAPTNVTLINGWVGSARLARSDDVITLTMFKMDPKLITDQQFANLPTGFRSISGDWPKFPTSATNVMFNIRMNPYWTMEIRGADPGSAVVYPGFAQLITWPTNDAPPTTLTL